MLIIRQAIVGEALGLDMYEAHRDGEELPEVDLDLPPELEKLEMLINTMTSFRPVDRPTAKQIELALTTIIKEVRTW